LFTYLRTYLRILLNVWSVVTDDLIGSLDKAMIGSRPNGVKHSLILTI